MSRAYYGIQTGAAFFQGMMDAFNRATAMQADIAKFEKMYGLEKQTMALRERSLNLAESSAQQEALLKAADVYARNNTALAMLNNQISQDMTQWQLDQQQAKAAIDTAVRQGKKEQAAAMLREWQAKDAIYRNRIGQLQAQMDAIKDSSQTVISLLNKSPLLSGKINLPVPETGLTASSAASAAPSLTAPAKPAAPASSGYSSIGQAAEDWVGAVPYKAPDERKAEQELLTALQSSRTQTPITETPSSTRHPNFQWMSLETGAPIYMIEGQTEVDLGKDWIGMMIDGKPFVRNLQTGQTLNADQFYQSYANQQLAQIKPEQVDRIVGNVIQRAKAAVAKQYNKWDSLSGNAASASGVAAIILNDLTNQLIQETNINPNTPQLEIAAQNYAREKAINAIDSMTQNMAGEDASFFAMVRQELVKGFQTGKADQFSYTHQGDLYLSPSMVQTLPQHIAGRWTNAFFPGKAGDEEFFGLNISRWDWQAFKEGDPKRNWPGLDHMVERVAANPNAYPDLARDLSQIAAQCTVYDNDGNSRPVDLTNPEDRRLLQYYISALGHGDLFMRFKPVGSFMGSAAITVGSALSKPIKAVGKGISWLAKENTRANKELVRQQTENPKPGLFTTIMHGNLY